MILCGNRIPGYVNRLARVGRLVQCVLPASLIGAENTPTPDLELSTPTFTAFSGPSVLPLFFVAYFVSTIV